MPNIQALEKVPTKVLSQWFIQTPTLGKNLALSAKTSKKWDFIFGVSLIYSHLIVIFHQKYKFKISNITNILFHSFLSILIKTFSHSWCFLNWINVNSFPLYMPRSHLFYSATKNIENFSHWSLCWKFLWNHCLFLMMPSLGLKLGKIRKIFWHF